MFIVIEGLDGSGKSTQVRRLGEFFAARGEDCLITRLPADNEIGKLARAATQGVFSAESEALALLFAADMAQHHFEEVAPALTRGEHVICDRYYYSTMAYQGENDDAITRILAYNRYLRSLCRPDAVIFLDIEPSECMRRISATRTEISIYETADKLKHLRERFHVIFDRLSKTENIHIIGGGDEDAVFEKILHKIAPLCSN
ncbi:MAG: dTMP kinase [Defluviitaleaceae bacterium]|nr:dTMP kinase [Defluviitaleaceae bacterium]